MWDEETNCVRCGAALSLEDYQSTLCENCQALLDQEIDAEEAETRAAIDAVPDDVSDASEGVATSADLPGRSGAESGVERQERYTKEDHTWDMNHDRWGRNPRDRDP